MEQEEQIIKAISNGNRQAFSKLYLAFSDKVYNTALSYTKSIEEAEEITQDVFTKIFINAAKFQGKSTLSTWIYRIAVNTSISHLKKRNRFSFLDFNSIKTLKPDFEHPGVILENKEDSKLLYQVIDNLPTTQKTAFILSFIEELPRQDVADIMETSLKAVESLLQRAKKKMRYELEKRYPNRRNHKKN